MVDNDDVNLTVETLQASSIDTLKLANHLDDMLRDDIIINLNLLALRNLKI